MKENKILSIIVPTYNMEKYLRKCLDSLIVSDENMEHLEVLVINDGSKDSSSQIAHEYEAKYPQTFKVIDKENGNYGSCINRGLKETTGKYVKVLDADDSFCVDVLESYISYLQERDDDMILTDFYVVDDKGMVLKDGTYPLPVDKTFGLVELERNAINTSKMCHHAITYKTEILKAMEYQQTEGLSYTDDEWVFKPMAYIKKISYYNYPLYSYLRGREGQTFELKVLMKNYQQRFVVMKSMINYYVEVCDKCNNDVRNFLLVGLSGKLYGIYHLCFIENTVSGNNKLIEFDKELKENAPSVYESLDNCANKLKWHVVRNWRKHHYNRNTFMLMVLRIYKNIVPPKFL